MSRARVTRDIIGYWVMVQSALKGCSHIRNSMDKCLEVNREKVKNMTEEGFNKSRDSVLTKLKEKDKNQAEDRARMYSGELETHRYQFDR